MGFIYGLLFGLLKVENDYQDKVKKNLLYSLPIGIILGGALGAINEWLRCSGEYETISASTNPQYQSDL